MKTTYFKQLFIALFLLITSAGTAVAASWKLSSTSLNQPGSMDTLCVEIVDNDFSFAAFQVDVQLPAGMIIYSGPFLGDSIPNWEYSYNIMGQDDHVRLVAYEATNKPLIGGKGTLFYLPVKIEADFQRGSIAFSKAVLSREAAFGKEMQDQTINVYAQKPLVVKILSGMEQMVNSQKPAVLTYETVPANIQLADSYFLDENCQQAASEADRMKPGIIYVKLSYAGDDKYAPFSEVYKMTITDKPTLKVVNISGLTQMESSHTPASITYETEPAGLPLIASYFTDADCTKLATDADRMRPGLIYVVLSYAGNDSIAAFKDVYKMTITPKPALQVEITSPLTQMESSTPVVLKYQVTPATLQDELTLAYFLDENCTKAATEADRTKAGNIYAQLTYAGNDSIAAFKQVYKIELVARGTLVVNVSGLEQMESSKTPAAISYTTEPANIKLDVAYFKDDSCKMAATETDRMTAGTIYAKLTYAGNDSIAAFSKIYKMTITPRKALVVSVSNLEQVYNSSKAAEISYTTVPASIKLEVAYYTDKECTIPASDAERKKVNTLYVKLTYGGDNNYGRFEQVYTLVLTDKKDLSAEQDVVFRMPDATAIVKGQPLGNSQLVNGSVTVGGLNMPGTFMWTEPTLKPEAGKTKYGVTFVPNNANYAAKDSLVELTVKDIFRIAVESGENGSAMIIGQTKDSLYVEGEQITLKAMPDANYQFAGWTLRAESETTAGDKAEMSVKVVAAGTYVATFAPIKHKVTKSVTGDGTLTVTVVESNQIVNDGDQIQQGSTLKVEAKAGENYQLSALTLNNLALAGDKFTLAGAATLQAVFTEKPAERRSMTINPVTNGSLVVYNAQGSPVASGSTLAEGETITLVALPAAGYQVKANTLKVGGTTLTGNTYTVGTDNFTASVEFEAKKYAVSAKSVKADGSKEETATITLSVTGEQAYGTEVGISNVSGEGKLIAILANGKDYGTDWKNLSFTVTGKLEVTAMFDMRVDIEPRYIMWPYQEYYYNGTSRNFIPFASQTYAGFDFKVMYQLGDADAIEHAINAGNYKVNLSREQDALYNRFEKTIEDGLVIKKSKVTVTEAPADPASENSKPKTRPENTEIKRDDSDNNFIKYTIKPIDKIDKQNYDTIVYYVEKAGAKKAKFSVGSRLKGTADGGVRITNGGEVITADSLAVGMQVYLEAVPNEGFKFTQWTDGNKENPRLATISEDEEKNNFVPEFMGKKRIELTVKNGTYTGAAQQPKLEGADEQLSFKVDAFTDPKRTQPASEIKNAGTYYLKIYRAEDTTYQAYQNETLTFKIEKATLKAEEITWPTASDIKVGDALSASTLMGGSAGIVTGTFEWANPTEQATETGTNSFKVKFVPNDTKNYPASVESTVNVNVLEAPVAALTLNKATMSLTKDNTETLIVTGKPEGATATWSSDNEAVATVDNTGKVTAVAAGTATITVTVQTNSGTLTATCVVTVTEPTPPEQPTEPTNPEQPVKPEQVPDPVVEQRTDSTAVITWDKVSGAESYRLFLYADKSKKELIATYTFDKDGNLKASNIAFNLQNLVAGKSYYIETVAYDATGKALVTKSIELTAEPTATEEVASSIEVYISRGMIHIQLSQPMGVRVMNMAGSFVYDTAAAEGRVDVPVASAGIYAVILYERSQLIEVKKVIVR